MPIIRLLLLLPILISAQLSLLGEDGDNSAGMAVMTMLKYSGEARNTALGGYAGSLMSGSEAVISNPARLTSQNRSDIRFSHTELGTGLRTDKVAIAFPTYEYGAFAFEWSSFRSGTIENARDIDENPVSVQTGDISFGGAYALSFLDGNLSAGLHAQFLQSSLADYRAKGFAVNASVNGRFTDAISGSIAIRNIGSQISYVDTNESLPLGLTGSISAVILNGKAAFVAGAAKFADDPLNVGGGIEATPHPALALRAGYSWKQQKEALAGASALDGMRFGVGLNISDFKINYAFSQLHSYLGASHVFDLSYSFNQIVPPGADDYLRRAQRQFRETRYEKCISTAETALRLNPNLWQAYALIEEARRMIKIREGSLVSIFYTGNTNGVFVPSIDNGLGGLARRSGILKSLRNDYPYSITVDAGNLISVDPDTLMWDVGYRIHKEMKYTAMNVGQNEVGSSVTAVKAVAEKAGVPILSSTLSATVKGLEGRIIESAGGGYKAAVFGATVLRTKSKLDPATLLRPLMNPVRDEVNLIILLFSGTMEQARVIARALPYIDAIVCGAEKAPSYSAVQEGRTLIVSPGKDGSYVGVLTLNFNKEKKITGFRNKVIPVDASSPEDEAIAHALRSFSLKGQIEPQDTTFNPDDKWLPFVSKYDFTSYYGKRMDSTQIDSVVWLRLGREADPFTPAFDSARKAIREADSVKVASDMKRGGQVRMAEPGDTTNQIYIQSVRSGKKRRLSFNRRRNREPEINYQNTGVLFFADSIRGSKTITDLFVYFPIYNITKRLEREQNATPLSAAWSAEGDAVFVVEKERDGKSELYLQAVKSKGRINISRTKDASEYEVTASPDGKNIAFTSDKEFGRPVYISDVYGEKPLRIMDGHSYCSNPIFSPGGRYLAFTSNSGRNVNYGDLMLHDIKTGRLDTLISGQPVHKVAWSDENTLFAVQGEKITDIIRITLSDRSFVRHTERSKKDVISEQYPRPYLCGDTLKVFYEQVIDGKVEVLWTESPSNRPMKFYAQPDVVRLR
ncbi:MAG: PorV/PorQ family protein [Fibrobacteres bacterium]|nr:PorV/PorQ family protein [Fibrobacterota bacterium]